MPRKIIDDPKGGKMSTKGITITDRRINNGRPTNIPTIFSKGFKEPRQVTQEAAIRRIVRAHGTDPETGKKVRSYSSIDEAVTASKNLSRAAHTRLAPKASTGLLNIPH